MERKAKLIVLPIYNRYAIIFDLLLIPKYNTFSLITTKAISLCISCVSLCNSGYIDVIRIQNHRENKLPFISRRDNILIENKFPYFQNLVEVKHSIVSADFSRLSSSLKSTSQLNPLARSTAPNQSIWMGSPSVQ